MTEPVILRHSLTDKRKVLTTIANTSGNRIAVFMLKGNDSLTIATGVNNPIFVHGGVGDDVVVGNDANDTIVSASGGSFILAGNGDFISTGSSTPETRGLFSTGRIVDTLFGAEDDVHAEPLLF